MQYVTRDKVLTNRPHMKWMLEKILRSVIPDAQDRWTFGSLSRQDYARTVQVMTEQGMIRSAPSYEEFTAGGLGYVPTVEYRQDQAGSVRCRLSISRVAPR